MAQGAAGNRHGKHLLCAVTSIPNGSDGYNSSMETRTDRSRDSLDADFTPMERAPVVRVNPETHERELVRLRWGLIPSSAHDPSLGSRLIHARSETVATKPAFRESFRQRRCLVVVDSFDIGKRRGKGKKSYLIQMKDRKPFGVGAIWEWWQQGDEQIESCAIITTAANTLVSPINDRMPVIIAQEGYGPWLDPKFQDGDELERMMQPFSAEMMAVVPAP